MSRWVLVFLVACGGGGDASEPVSENWTGSCDVALETWPYDTITLELDTLDGAVTGQVTYHNGEAAYWFELEGTETGADLHLDVTETSATMTSYDLTRAGDALSGLVHDSDGADWRCDFTLDAAAR